MLKTRVLEESCCYLVWTEGVDFEILPGGKVRCLHCDKVLEGKAGLGPHLSACPERKAAEKVRAEPSGEVKPAPVPEDSEVLKDILVKFGMKTHRADGVSMLMAHAGWDNFHELKYFCSNCGMNPDRISLVLRAWSNHRGVIIPLEVLNELQKSQHYTLPHPQQSQQSTFVTKEDLKAEREQTKKDLKTMFDAEREKRKDEEEKRELNRTLRAIVNRQDTLEEKVKEQGNVRTGKTLYDLVGEGMQQADTRASEFMKRVPLTQELNPVVSRTPAQRKAKAETIEQQIVRKEKLLIKENEFIDACAEAFKEVPS